MSTNRYQKLCIALQNYLYGARYYTALKAFHFAKNTHNGFRKDGVTPEFQHQIEIALFITTLRDVDDEEGTITAVLLHDVLEDFDEVTVVQLIDLVGSKYVTPVRHMSKKIGGMLTYDPKYPSEYFRRIARCPIASIAKGGDRVHNLGSMTGVFSLEKQKLYIDETEQYFLPMLKEAAQTHPMQYLAYMNIRTMLKTQVGLVKASLGALCIECTE